MFRLDLVITPLASALAKPLTNERVELENKSVQWFPMRANLDASSLGLVANQV